MDRYLPYLVIAIAMAFFIRRRVRRSIGFQKYSERALITRIVIFTAIAAFLLSYAFVHPMAFIGYGIGTVLGLALVYVAIKETVFEKREKGLYFRTHIWIEMTILALFFARILYRGYLIYSQMNHESPNEISIQPQNARDPFTGALFFILCAYYIGYNSYMLRAGRKQEAAMLESAKGEGGNS